MTKKLTLSAMFVAVGIVLPFFTGQIPQIGSMLLPLHIPVFLCGLICGWKYGLVVGFILPLLRSILFSMPPMYPVGVAMAFELATYGLVVGWLFNKGKWQCVVSLYRSMVCAMLAGRIVWGIVEVILLGLNGFTWMMFISGAFITSLPGIILQLILIPTIMIALDKANIVPFKKCRATKKLREF